MTTPNQPAPTWMELLGLGAFQIGGSGGGSGLSKYGQGIDESFVNDLIYGPLAPSNLAANSGAVSDLIPVMQQMIAGVPLPVLKYLQPFIPGATDADFADSATAAAFIVSTFIPKMIIDTTNWLGRFFKDVEILFDVFHITYPVGTSTDPAGQTSWYAAWNDVLELIGLYSGTTPTTTAPTIGPAITVAGIAGANGSSWSTRLTNDLLILFDVFHLTYTSTQWNNAWTDLLALFGVVNSTTTPTNPAPTIGTAITGAQGTANTAASWGARLTNDLIVTSDVFHLVYHTGTPTDAPGLIYTGGGLGNGKMTWYGAWNDLLALCGVVNSVTAPTDAAPTTGAVIAANTATATTASTNASLAIATNQHIIDGIFDASNGGATTGNPVTSVVTSLTAIPASNIIGTTGAAVAFGAVGAANFSVTSSSTMTLSEVHSILSTDLGVLVFVSYFGGATTTFGTTVTYGGVAMTQVGPAQQSGTFSGGGALFLEVWWLKSPPTGAQTVTAVTTRVSGAASNVIAMALDSVSYLASKISSITAYTGGGSSPISMTKSSSTGKMLVGGFALGNTASPLTQSSFSQTSHWAQVYNTNLAAALGDANGASSVTFSEVVNSPTTTQWVGYIVELSN